MKRRAGRAVDGVLLLDKPPGLTSNAALQTVKHLLNARKAGHTGSLDPLASGLLPLCLGEATKISGYLLDADKRYVVRARLGERTTTGDAEGEVVERRSTEGIDAHRVEQALGPFRGRIEQIPPMYSALKHQGQRLYALARQGIEVAREPRTVEIRELVFQGLADGEISFEVACSKGTYIRTLAEDIGETLGCGAHVTWLRRTGVGPYREDGMVTLDHLREILAADPAAADALILPIESAVQHWPAVFLTRDATWYLRQGQPVMVPKAPAQGWVRIYGSDQRFLGVGEIQDDGLVAPRRMVKVQSSGAAA